MSTMFDTYDVYTLDTEEFIGQFEYEHTTWLMATPQEIDREFITFCNDNGLDPRNHAYERAL